MISISFDTIYSTAEVRALVSLEAFHMNSVDMTWVNSMVDDTPSGHNVDVDSNVEYH